MNAQPLSLATPPKIEPSRVSRSGTLKPDVARILTGCTGPVFSFRQPGNTEAAKACARTILACDPLAVISIAGGQATVSRRQGQTDKYPVSDPLAFLQAQSDAYKARFETNSLPSDLPFAGGMFGYLGYRLTSYLEGITGQSAGPVAVPDAVMAIYDAFVVADHSAGTVEAVSFRGQEHAQHLLALFSQDSSAPAKPATVQVYPGEPSEGAVAQYSRSEFIARVKKAKELIAAGEIFQIVLSQRFSLPTAAGCAQLHEALAAASQASYSYMFSCPDFSYVGVSPETFLQCRRGQLSLCALAGTRARGQNRAQDRHQAKELRSNEKELAEHMMLVDLGRNDLGRVCRPGSVRTGRLAAVTTYANVMHLATRVEGRLDTDQSVYSAIASCFPAGTVSGAPKVRAMEHLSELESEDRGIYAGAVGYIDFRDDCQLAIAIRSALLKDGMAHVQSGAGIVFDSEPESEYLETLHKASAVVAAIRSCQEKEGESL